MVEVAGEEEQELAVEMAQQFLKEELQENVFGEPKAGNAMWASVVRIVSGLTGKTLHEVHLEQNEATFSIALVRFACNPLDLYVLIGVARSLKLRPRQVDGGAILTYKLNTNGDNLEFVHKTFVDEVPGAICAFQGRVLIGVGRLLRIYDLGKKKLLRKCENKVNFT